MTIFFTLLFGISMVFFLIGLDKPEISLFWLQKNRTMKMSGLIYGVVAFWSLIITLFLSDDKTIEQKLNSTSTIKVEKKLSNEQKDSISKVERVQQIENRKRATFSASDLVAFYTQNEINADNRLKGKPFYVEGRIESISKDIFDEIYITLESGDIVRSVQCYIDDNELVASLRKGQRITVFGKCEGLMMNVLMKDCKVVANLSELEKQK